MPVTLRRISVIIGLALVIGAGYVLTLPQHSMNAGGGYPPQVLALKAGIGPTALVDAPTSDAQIVTELVSGDRVLRIKGAIAIRDEGVYIPVYTATGAFGWLLNGEAITEPISPVYTTNSHMEAGGTLVVEDAGSVDCRRDPSFNAEIVQTLESGAEITLAGGPYSAELGLWWTIISPDSASCWVYDSPGRFALVN